MKQTCLHLLLVLVVVGSVGLTAVAWLLFSGSWYLWPDSLYTPPQWPGWLFGPVILALWGSFLVAQTIRYRRASSPAERQQTKWVLFGIAVAVLVGPPVWELHLQHLRQAASRRPYKGDSASAGCGAG